MRFCQHCNSIMEPREKAQENVLFFQCVRCLHEERAFGEGESHKPIYTNNLAALDLGSGLLVGPDMHEDPTLPRSTTRECKKCGNSHAVFYQTENSQQGMVLHFICRTCQHRWNSETKKNKGGQAQPA